MVVSSYLFWQKRKVKREYYVFFVYLLFSLFSQVILSYLAAYGLRNITCVNIYMVLEIGLLTYFFTLVIHSKRTRQFVVFTAVLLLVYLFFEIITKSLDSVFTLFMYIESLLFAFFCFLYLLQCFNDFETDLPANPNFWVVSGLFYYFVSYMLFSGSHYLTMVYESNLAFKQTFAFINKISGVLSMLLYIKGNRVIYGK